MKLDKLSLHAFGRFQRTALELEPGLNIIYGPNEAGKSTLQTFLLGMLYGLKKRSGRREASEEAYRYRPWQGADYRGALLYTLEQTGQQIRVERNFEPGRDEVKLYDGVTGMELTDRFPMDRRKEVLFAEAHLGMKEHVFTSTAWVGQMQVGHLEAGRELLSRVSNLQETGREDLSLKAAIGALEDRMKEIGTERAPTRPYGRVLRSMEEKRQELERAERARERTLAWEARLTEVRAVLDELNAEVGDLEWRLSWALYHEARRQLERQGVSDQKLNELRGRLAAHAPYKEFPAHLRADLHRWQADLQGARLREERLTQRLRDLARTEGDLRAVQEQYGELANLTDAQVEDAAATLSRLEQLKEQQEQVESEARRLGQNVKELDALLEPLTKVAKHGDRVLAKLEEEDRELHRLRRQMDGHNLSVKRQQVASLEQDLKGSGGGLWLAVGVIFSLAGAAVTTGYGALVGLPAEHTVPAMGGAYTIAVLALGLWVRARLATRSIGQELKRAAEQLKEEERMAGYLAEQIASLERSKEQHLRDIGVISPAEVRNQVVRYEQLTARREGLVLRLETLRGEHDRLTQDVRRATRLLESVTGDIDMVDAFAAVRDLKRQLSLVSREYEEAVRQHNAETESAAEAEEALNEAFAAAGVADMTAFDEGCARREAYLQAAAELATLESALHALVPAEGAEAVAVTLEQLERTLTGEPPATVESSAQLQAEVRRREARRAELAAQASDLSARIETALKEMADTADLRRELAALQEEREGLEAELSALELARSTIEAVGAEMHREFAPRLNRAMGDIVESLTDGKYRAVQVDEELGIRVLTDQDQTVDLESLSGGTVDQFYLGLRLALLDLLTESDEQIPLILDDPFTQYDDERTRSALEFLAGAAEERQVLLLTCHQREVRFAQELGLGARIINLAEV